jgi:hypothetical protein
MRFITIIIKMYLLVELMVTFLLLILMTDFADPSPPSPLTLTPSSILLEAPIHTEKRVNEKNKSVDKIARENTISVVS